MVRTKTPKTRREILEDARWEFATGGLPDFLEDGEIRTFPDLAPLLRSYFGSEENAVGVLLGWLAVDAYAATLLEVGPWHPADVLRLHPLAFASPAISGMVTNIVTALRQGFPVPPHPPRDSSWEGAFPVPTTPENGASAEALRGALSRVAGTLCAIPDGSATARRAWRAFDLRDEVRRVARDECNGSVKAAYPVVARRRGCPSGAALRQEIRRALRDLLAEALRAERSHTFVQLVMTRFDIGERNDFFETLVKQRDQWATPPAVTQKTAETAPGVPPPGRRTSSGASTRAKGGRHDELPHDNRSRRPAQGAAPNPPGVEAQREGAAILQALRKPRSVRGRGADPVPRGSDVRSHGRGDGSARKRPGRVKEPP